MSRSYRKPYSCVTTCKSAKKDKAFAARGVRRSCQRWIHRWEELEENTPFPHHLECFHNDVWDWRRDGHQHYQGLDARDWSRYLESLEHAAAPRHRWEAGYYQRNPPVWPPKWYVELLRK